MTVESGVLYFITDQEHILYINFEDIGFANLLTAKELHEYIIAKIKDDKKYFIFLDEIQDVVGWEKAVNSLRLRNTDIYITGSNSQLLSGELATHIAGRHVSFEIYPLSFQEFVNFRWECLPLTIGQMDSLKIPVGELDSLKIPYNKLDEGIKKNFKPSESYYKHELGEYIRIGGFPALSTSPYSHDRAKKIVEDIHSSAVLKDVIKRHKVKNVALLERIIAYIYDNVGSLLSIRNIENYLKNNGGGNFETISNYIGHLENACIIKKAQRYEIKGKKLLESNDKYYLADHSLQYAIRDFKEENMPRILENIVFNELIRRGYKVYVGKMSNTDSREIDFVAEKNNGDEKVYVQVCYEYSSAETRKREFTPLTEIKDHYPKYVVTYRSIKDNVNGVVGIPLEDFLLKETL